MHISTPAAKLAANKALEEQQIVHTHSKIFFGT
jgi:hypothetical protein